mmetsp:Transcript_20723/g.23795  ORF Transcript_20723/g.23795 Transcript_20723/m.23795 type:complete len:138 (+) Transcript_20723:125-538(+)
MMNLKIVATLLPFALTTTAFTVNNGVAFTTTRTNNILSAVKEPYLGADPPLDFEWDPVADMPIGADGKPRKLTREEDWAMTRQVAMAYLDDSMPDPPESPAEFDKYDYAKDPDFDENEGPAYDRELLARCVKAPEKQ